MMPLEIRSQRGELLARVLWQGAKPPSARERQAIARAFAAGRIKAGDHLGRSSSASAEREFKAFHWGRAPKRAALVKAPGLEHGIYELGELVAVEYETIKGRERAVWVHQFGKPRPKLTATPSGRLGPIIGGKARVTPRGIEG